MCNEGYHALPMPVQIARMAVSGMRPEIPPAADLPGPGAAEFAGLSEYCQLIRRASGPLRSLGWAKC